MGNLFLAKALGAEHNLRESFTRLDFAEKGDISKLGGDE